MRGQFVSREEKLGIFVIYSKIEQSQKIVEKYEEKCRRDLGQLFFFEFVFRNRENIVEEMNN